MTKSTKHLEATIESNGNISTNHRHIINRENAASYLFFPYLLGKSIHSPAMIILRTKVPVDYWCWRRCSDQHFVAVATGILFESGKR